ncbi:MAG: tetratricopeptide repeat-containing sensor histidine kinase [Flavobacterium sp.]
MKAFILITFLLNCLLNYSQVNTSTIDSLKVELKKAKGDKQRIEVYRSLANNFSRINSDSSRYYINKFLVLATQKKLKDEIVYAYQFIGSSYLNDQNFPKALEPHLKAYELSKSLEEKDEQRLQILQNIGYVYYEMGDFVSAINLYLDALKYYESKSMYENVPFLYNNIGILFHQQRDFKKALLYYKKGIELLKKHPNINVSIDAMLETNMGLTYFELNDLDNAKLHYEKSIEYNKKHNDPRIYTVNIGNLASIYSKRKEYKIAEKYFNEAIIKSNDANNIESAAVNYGDLGRMYLAMAQDNLQGKNNYLQKAIINFNQALKIFKEINDLRRYEGYALDLSEAYELKGDYIKALAVYKEHIVYKDSLFNSEYDSKLNKIEMQYEFEKKEGLLRSKNEKELALKDIKIKNAAKQTWYLLIGILLLTIIGSLLYYQNINRKSHNSKLMDLNKALRGSNQVKTRLLNILNHDLRAPISNIIKLIYLQQNPKYILDDTEQNNLQKETLTSAENLLDNMNNLLIWSKGQMNNFKPKFQEVNPDLVFKDIAAFFVNYNTISMRFENPEKLTLTTDEDYLKTIMRNLTSNAIKALEKRHNPEIVWKLYTDNNLVVLSITDNGKGADVNHFKPLFNEDFLAGINTGLGLHLVRDIAKIIQVKINVITDVEKGTTLKIIFPSIYS